MTYYMLLYRLDGIDAFVLWFANDLDGVITTPEGRMLSFPTTEALLAYAQRRGFDVSSDDPSLHDLDVVQGLLADPRAETINCSEVLSAWNLFEDVARSGTPGAQDFINRSSECDALYNKVFWGKSLPAVTPEGKRYDPKWNAEEVACLSDLMARGLALFRSARIEAV